MKTNILSELYRYRIIALIISLCATLVSCGEVPGTHCPLSTGETGMVDEEGRCVREFVPSFASFECSYAVQLLFATMRTGHGITHCSYDTSPFLYTSCKTLFNISNGQNNCVARCMLPFSGSATTYSNMLIDAHDPTVFHATDVIADPVGRITSLAVTCRVALIE